MCLTASISTIIKILTSEFLSSIKLRCTIIIPITTRSPEVHHHLNSSECDDDANLLCLDFCSNRKAREQEKKVVVAGCVPQAQPRMDYLKGLSIIGVRQSC